MIRQPKKGMSVELHYKAITRIMVFDKHSKLIGSKKGDGRRNSYHLQFGVIVIAPRTGRGIKNSLVRLDNGEMIIVPAGNLFEIKEKK